MARRKSGEASDREPKPTGPLYTVDDEWKRNMRALIEEEISTSGISRAEIARQIGVTNAALTLMFRAGTSQTTAVPALHRRYGLVLPETAVAVPKDAFSTRLLRETRDLSENAQALVLRLVRAMRDLPEDKQELVLKLTENIKA